MSRDESAQYYDAGGIETLDIVKAKLTREQYIGYLLGTSLVYQCRMMHKGQSLSDARKAANYSKWLADELEGETEAGNSVVEKMTFEWRRVNEMMAVDEIAP